MKKISLLFVLLLTVITAFTQTLTESFNGTTFPPTGWQNIQVSGSGLWNRVTSGVEPACTPHSGAGMAQYNSYDFQPNANALLITPLQTFTGTSVHELSFWMYADAGWLIYPDSVGVYYNTSANLTGSIHLATIPRYNPVEGWYKHSFLLPASLTGGYYIIFRGYSQYGNNMFLDDVKLVVPPTEDLSAVSIDNDVYLTSGISYTPQATFKNTGINTVNANVTFEGYDYSNNLIYSSTKPITSLSSWDVVQVSFDPVALPNPEAIYTGKVYTSLTGDLENSNDTIRKTFYTYTHNKQTVMLEVGTGTWCQYCPGAAMGADDLVTNGKQVAVVENHNGDTYAYPSSDARNTYYEITGYPTAIFDGIKKLVGGNHTTSLYTSYLPIYESRYAIKSAFGLTVSGSASGNNFNISVVVDRYGETPFANSNLVLHMALTQSHLQVNWQGQTHLEYVSRVMVPDANGTPIDLSSAMQVTVPLTFTLNTAWGGSIANHDYEVVTWIQDLATKEIVDAQKYDLADISVGVNELNSDLTISGISPNPASTNTSIRFYLHESAQTTIEIYDITGQLVKTLVNSNMGAGSRTIDWDITNNGGTNVESGLYLCKIKAGNRVSSSKILVVK